MSLPNHRLEVLTIPWAVQIEFFAERLNSSKENKEGERDDVGALHARIQSGALYFKACAYFAKESTSKPRAARLKGRSKTALGVREPNRFRGCRLSLSSIT